MNTRIRIKRAYDPPEKNDGYRILVDRLWPRGIRKKNLAMAEWRKDLAPSNELREQFAHRPEHWDFFRTRYLFELRSAQPEIRKIATMAARKPVTLLYAAKDQEHNNAVVLKEAIDREINRQARSKAA